MWPVDQQPSEMGIFTQVKDFFMSGVGRRRTERRVRLDAARRSACATLGFVLDALLVLGLLAHGFGLDGLACRHRPDALAGDRSHFFGGIKRLLLAWQASSAPRCRASRA